MRALKVIGNTVLWLVAALGLASVLVWGATQAGWIKPLVVISGSMEPEIMTGDLVVAVPRPTADLRVGDVASIHSDVTGNLVSHRVVGVEQVADDRWEIRMKGDANDSEDSGAYVVGDSVWRPAVQISGGGYALTTLTRPSVAIPLGVALLSLLGLSLLPRSAPRAPAGDRMRTEVVEAAR
ncbi:signal peptidase I [Cellulomonas palmilytica]|uniref:signal peptidase I n=1 Tax=Cellulomonas palmilytica TaxID=2608402 RepID=UPI001F29E8BA|nr:signal peptidase I [Cellulomonas palmilytica]UJP40957.1 signal peptidase I [Cellulomonas palmilytica]